MLSSAAFSSVFDAPRRPCETCLRLILRLRLRQIPRWESSISGNSDPQVTLCESIAVRKSLLYRMDGQWNLHCSRLNPRCCLKQGDLTGMLKSQSARELRPTRRLFTFLLFAFVLTLPLMAQQPAHHGGGE